MEEQLLGLTGYRVEVDGGVSEYLKTSAGERRHVKVELVLDALCSIDISCRSRHALPKSQQTGTSLLPHVCHCLPCIYLISPLPNSTHHPVRLNICGRHITRPTTVLLVRAHSLMRCERASKSSPSRRKLYLYALGLVAKVSRIHLPCLLYLISKASRTHVLTITPCRAEFDNYLFIQHERTISLTYLDQPCHHLL